MRDVGYRLYREVRDSAPAEWTASERLVAWALADDANDETRRSWIKIPELMKRTGFRSERGLRMVLQKLADSGYEFRMVLTRDKQGRPVFAVKGRSLDFQVPRMGFTPPALVGGTDIPPNPIKEEHLFPVGGTDVPPLSSQSSPQADQKKAPRRAAHSVLGDKSDTQPILDDVRRAAVNAYGDVAADLTDEQALHIYERFCCNKAGQPYRIAADPYAYLAGGPLNDVPTLAQALQPTAKRRIPVAALRRFNDPETPDGDLVGIVESVTGTLSPGEEPAVEKMIMDGRPLHYIVNAVFSGNLNVAA
jgi:hypothetical protein